MKTEKQLEDSRIALLLKTVADHFDQEDRPTREAQVRRWRRLKLYWANFSQIYWSESAQNYQIYNRDTQSTDTDQDYYDKPVNVFRAFLETLIAAMSIQIPAINCSPDDAENPLDIATAKAGDEIARLISLHNDSTFLWLQSLYVYCTEGLIACYNYTKTDKEYGTYPKDKYKDVEVEGIQCPSCKAQQPDDAFSDDILEKFDPDETDAPLQAEIEAKGSVCIECGIQLDPNLEKTKFIVKRLDGVTREPKTRVCLKVMGGLYVKIANYAKKLCDSPYLIWSYETHYVNALNEFESLRNRIAQGGWYNAGVNDPYEEYGRLNTQYRGEFPEENVTVKTCWLRPASFNILDDEDFKYLKNKFPMGAKVVIVNDVVADFCAENVDDHWTVTEDPLTDYLNHDPLGELLTNIQDITNDLISLTLQTIEHGITQTWADPAVVNFNAQRQIEATPGTLTPTKPMAPGRAMSEAFHETKTAALAPEVVSFYKIIQELGQFVSGALPSLFGGSPGAGSSRTASEYAMAKGQAMQRLQTPWRMMSIWWKKVFLKAIPMYMKEMQTDERIVKKNDQGNYINVFLRKAELGGTIGDIELEPDEKMPITDEQKADLVLQLLGLNNQEVNAALMSPENLPTLGKITKMPLFKLPGEEDRQKQLEEIEELVNSTPIPPSPESLQLFQQAQQLQASTPDHNTPPPMPPEEQPSVAIEPDVDDHQVEATVCKGWLVGPAGRLAKKENPNGYKNVLLHMKAHLAILAQQLQAQQAHDDQMALAGVKNNDKTSDSKGSTPPMKPKESEKVTGESNAKVPVQ